MNILRGIANYFWDKKKKSSLGRRSDNDVLPLTGTALAFGLVSTLAFMATNFIAWNFHFPTPLERLLWRISSCGLVGVSAVGVLLIELMWNDEGIKRMQEAARERRKELADSEPPHGGDNWKDHLIYRFRVFKMRICNNSPDNDPNLDTSFLFVFLVVPGFAIYTIFRLYILVEDVIAFRALPAEAYMTVD